jgi:DNA-binding GntR family transcriptional regulator
MIMMQGVHHMAKRSEERPSLHLQIPVSFKASATDVVFDALHEAILSQTLPGGTPLIEVQLADMFRVSKTPVREALQRLAQTGLVDVVPIRGATVHEITATEIKDIFELRLVLEPLALKQSVPNLSDNELELLETLLRDAKRALQKRDWQTLSQHNTAFHETLVSGGGNQLLLTWLKSLSERRRLISMQGWLLDNRSAKEWQEHKSILEAVKARDTKLAAKRLEQHIQNFAAIVLKNYAVLKNDRETHG